MAGLQPTTWPDLPGISILPLPHGVTELTIELVERPELSELQQLRVERYWSILTEEHPELESNPILFHSDTSADRRTVFAFRDSIGRHATANQRGELSLRALGFRCLTVAHVGGGTRSHLFAQSSEGLFAGNTMWELGPRSFVYNWNTATNQLSWAAVTAPIIAAVGADRVHAVALLRDEAERTVEIVATATIPESSRKRCRDVMLQAPWLYSDVRWVDGAQAMNALAGNGEATPATRALARWLIE